MNSRVTAEQPLLLITNDDGVESVLLKSLVVRLSDKFKCVVAAPESEQSFCGRKLTLNRDVSVRALDDWPCEAFVVDGTPVDCVNIALGNLLERKPALVLSGPNIGRNCGEWTVLSSGTVAGAMEGALWNLPALAVSQSLDGLEQLKAIKAATQVPHSFLPIWEKGLAWVESLTGQILKDATAQCGAGIWNVNLPHAYAAEAHDPTEFPESPLAQARYDSVFQPSAAPNTYRYAHAKPRRLDALGDADIDRITCGWPSKTWLPLSS